MMRELVENTFKVLFGNLVSEWRSASRIQSKQSTSSVWIEVAACKQTASSTMFIRNWFMTFIGDPGCFKELNLKLVVLSVICNVVGRAIGKEGSLECCSRRSCKARHARGGV